MKMSEADFSMTQSAFENTRDSGRRMGPRLGDEVLLVKFFLEPVQNKAKSKEEGRPIFEDKEFVQIMVPGDKDSVVIRQAFEADKARFPQHYAAFKNKTGDILEGTPLSAWPMVTRAQVEELAFFNVRTVEQLAGMADAQAQKFMGIKQLQSLARVFLEDAGKKAPLMKMQKDLEERDATIVAMQKQMDAMNTQLEKMAGKE